MKSSLTALCITALLAVPAMASAEGDNLLACVDRGFILQKCVLESRALASAIIESERTYETEYLVNYDFQCFGNRSDVGVRAGETYVPFRMGALGETLHLSAVGELTTLDPDPAATARLSYRPGCSLRIRNVSAAPSFGAIRQWSDEAKSLARILDFSIQRYLLAKDYLEISQWNRDKLTLLKGKLEGLVAAYPTNLHYKVMLNHVNATLNNQPSSVTLAELTEAGEDVRVTLRRELDVEVAKGHALVERFTRWQQVAEATLQDVLNQIPVD